MESNGLGFDFTLLYIDLVPREDDRHVFADTDEIACMMGSKNVGLGKWVESGGAYDASSARSYM